MKNGDRRKVETGIIRQVTHLVSDIYEFARETLRVRNSGEEESDSPPAVRFFSSIVWSGGR